MWMIFRRLLLLLLTECRADVGRVGAEGGQQGPQLQHTLPVGRLQLARGLEGTWGDKNDTTTREHGE
jgi:hypothetical protein